MKAQRHSFSGQKPRKTAQDLSKRGVFAVALGQRVLCAELSTKHSRCPRTWGSTAKIANSCANISSQKMKALDVAVLRRTCAGTSERKACLKPCGATKTAPQPLELLCRTSLGILSDSHLLAERLVPDKVMNASAYKTKTGTCSGCRGIRTGLSSGSRAWISCRQVRSCWLKPEGWCTPELCRLKSGPSKNTHEQMKFSLPASLAASDG